MAQNAVARTHLRVNRPSEGPINETHKCLRVVDGEERRHRCKAGRHRSYLVSPRVVSPRVVSPRVVSPRVVSPRLEQLDEVAGRVFDKPLSPSLTFDKLASKHNARGLELGASLAEIGNGDLDAIP